MKVRTLVLTITMALTLIGCKLGQSPEDQCLHSSRLQFKDPDSGKVIANLGDRAHAQTKRDGGFWLRYSATNSYGGRVSSNMLCEKGPNGWARSLASESIALTMAGLDLTERRLEASIAQRTAARAEMNACKTQACRRALPPSDWLDPDGSRSRARMQSEAEAEAKRLIFDEVGKLENL